MNTININENYYVAINRRSKKCILSHNKTLIADFLNISIEEVNNSTDDGGFYSDNKCTMFKNPQVRNKL